VNEWQEYFFFICSNQHLFLWVDMAISVAAKRFLEAKRTDRTLNLTNALHRIAFLRSWLLLLFVGNGSGFCSNVAAVRKTMIRNRNKTGTKVVLLLLQQGKADDDSFKNCLFRQAGVAEQRGLMVHKIS
jgi:hypothetical protein